MNAKIQFAPYNESTVLQGAIEVYFERNGHYPVRVPATKASTKEEYQDNTDRQRRRNRFMSFHQIR